MNTVIEHPEKAFALLPKYKKDDVTYGDLIVVKWGESGYFKTNYDGEFTQKDVDEFNGNLGLSPAEGEAMHICSMCDNLTADKWDKHYEFVLESEKAHEVKKESEESKNG